MEKLESEGAKKSQSLLNLFLAMHITNQKLSFDIFTVQNIFMEHDLYLIPDAISLRLQGKLSFPYNCQKMNGQIYVLLC